MPYSKQIGNVRLFLEQQADVDRAEKIRRGVHYSAPNRPSSECLELETLRDEAQAARIRRAATKRKETE